MEEEFLESEVIFSDSDYDSESNSDPDTSNPNSFYSFRRAGTFTHLSAGGGGDAIVGKKKKMISSAPVNIPAAAESNRFGELGYGDGEEMVPPHLIIAMRTNQMGVGAGAGAGAAANNLRGKDLCRRRNSILRMIGFLEQ